VFRWDEEEGKKGGGYGRAADHRRLDWLEFVVEGVERVYVCLWLFIGSLGWLEVGGQRWVFEVGFGWLFCLGYGQAAEK